MLSLRAAATLLQRASNIAGLNDLARMLGFAGSPAPLDGPLRRELGLPPRSRAAVARGVGARRALLLDVPGSEPLREVLARVARRLAARSAEPLWCAFACERGGTQLIVATWSADSAAPRIRALTCHRDRLSDSDADTIRALHAALHASQHGDDLLVHDEWLELLGRDALSRRFYQEASAVVEALSLAIESPTVRLGRAERRGLALLQLSRILFLSFVEAKGWLDGDRSFLAHGFTRCAERGGSYDRRVLRPLFFGTLNTPPARRASAARAFGRVPFLNGGLFARTPLERRAKGIVYPDDALAPLFDRLLARYRFTAREDQATWSDAAIDPEMLGRAFESLMQPESRRSSGAYYTPQPIVAHITRAALRQALRGGDEIDALLAGEQLSGTEAAEMRRQLAALRVLDPACGSGAFLVHTLETLATLAALAGDRRPISELRRALLTSAIFGVDTNPTAVWLCELRLWLSVVIESGEVEPCRVPPLPNLDRNVRVGDALAGGGFADAPRPGRREGELMARLRRRYVRATGAAKATLARRLAAEERRASLALLHGRITILGARRRDLLAAVRGRDLFGDRQRPSHQARSALESLRAELRGVRARRRDVAAGGALPFAFATHFSDVVREGGFRVVIGNPPWVRLHRIAPAQRDMLRRDYAVVRDAAWLPEGSARLGSGFAAQVDLAAPFVERATALLAPGGALALLLPGKLWRSLAGGGVRRHLLARTRLVAIEDWTRSRHSFDAAVYPSVLVARMPPAEMHDPQSPGCVLVAEREGTGARIFTVSHGELPLDGEASSGAPWLLAPRAVRCAFQRLARAGTPLARSALGSPLLGVKCGYNAAFTLPAGDARRDGVEPALLRPLLRGDQLRPWQMRSRDELLLWTHDATGEPLRELPPAAMRALLPHRRRLEGRSDARGGGPWWKLFRTEAARCDVARVVWRDVGLAPSAVVLAPGDPTVPLNSCYVLPCRREDDAYAFATLLNSPLALAWLSLVAEPARGGYHRFLAWTTGLLPVPAEWARCRATLAALGRRSAAGLHVEVEELEHALGAAYRIDREAVAPLIAWSRRGACSV